MGDLRLTLKVFILALGYASTQDSDCDYSQRVQPGSTYTLTYRGYPNNYTPGVQCRWIAQCPSGYNCVVDCPSVDMPYTTSCTMDRLLISKTGDPQLSSANYYCGKGTVRAVSTGQILSVGLITSYNSPGGRFTCKLSAQPAAAPSCDCGYSKKPRIVGGNETAVNEYPSMVGIVLDAASAQIQCGGVIISKRYILTAAHCLINRNPKNMAVVVGEHDVTIGDSPATKAYRIEDFLIHPSFNPTSFDYDIAIIRTTEDIAFGPLVGPVCLPFKYVNQDLTGTKLTALGWGTLFIGGPTSNVLRKVDLNVISLNECRYYMPSVTSRQICTYTPGKDACQDDSGGPLLYTEPSTGLLFNMGIISFGELCATDDNPGVNTKVTALLSWVTSNTPDADYCRK